MINPTALAIAPDNSIYISNQAFLPGEGEILRVQVSTPEPTSLLGLFGITIGTVTTKLKRKKNS